MTSVETMIEKAREAMERAHAPYSRFKVGACLKAPGGELFAGCNVENASYPEGWCAETTAIGALVLAGHRQIEEVVVVTASPEPCPPCGGCLQRLREFAGPETPIHLVDGEGGHTAVTLGDLLPLSFSGRQLEPFLARRRQRA